MTNSSSAQPNGEEPVAATMEPPVEPARVLLHMPVDVRSVSLVVLATLASIFVLRWASAVCHELALEQVSQPGS